MATVKEMTSDELAEILRAMNTTGISPTNFEKDCLNEAADRLEKLDRVEKYVWGHKE